ncbi:gem-associated protein 2 [Lepeophtheirus salmonis]|uniref:gem-associated protein 2 n=1 Tax=Lepeophtheirus salmonis TaxID=72036 RepID=UPI00077EE233|nr:gem-associated protein 2-like [Lepeophtheirus salmonis]
MLNEREDENLLAKALYYQPDQEEEDQEADFSKPPTSADEYLRRVHQEAKKLQDVVVAEIDPKKLTQGQKYNYETRKKIQTSSGLLPSKEWQDTQIANFSQLRISIRLPSQTEKFQKKKTEKEWAIFCFGSLYWNKLVCMDEDRGGELVKENIQGTQPLLSVLASFRQTHVVDLLELMVSWTEELNILGSEQGSWFFSLLTLLEKPLHPDVISSLRSLALFCSQKREKEVEFIPDLNLFICLVAKYFGQADLSD